MEKPKEFEELANYIRKNGPLSEEVAKTIFINVNHVFESLALVQFFFLKFDYTINKFDKYSTKLYILKV